MDQVSLMAFRRLRERGLGSLQIGTLPLQHIYWRPQRGSHVPVGVVKMPAGERATPLIEDLNKPPGRQVRPSGFFEHHTYWSIIDDPTRRWNQFIQFWKDIGPVGGLFVLARGAGPLSFDRA
jgi:hypothetical protein